MLRILCPVVLSLLVFLSSNAYSQEKATGGGNIAILEVQFFPRMTRGKLDACELTYLLAFEDHVYRKGAMSFLRGSLVLWFLAHTGSVGASLN